MKEDRKRLPLMLGLLALPTTAAGSGQDAAKAERKNLHGTWKVTAVTYNGNDFYEKGQAAFDFPIGSDHLKLCVRIFGTDQPSRFEAPSGSNKAFLILKRRP